MINNFILFLVILNSVIGGGLFVNLEFFAQELNTVGFLLYPLGFLIFLPIIFCIGTLAQTTQSEGGLFYIVKKQLGEKIAFIAVWSYFLGRTVSVAVLLRTLVASLQSQIPQLTAYSENGLILFFAIFICIINTAGISNTGNMQKIFATFKLTPIIILILSGLFLITTLKVQTTLPSIFFSKLPQMLPTAIYGLQGFTIAIHIGHRIKYPQNVRNIMLLAMLIATIICTSFQFLIPITADSSTFILLKFTNKLLWLPNLTKIIILNLVNIAIFSSAFMILTGNSWNLFTLAKNGYLPFTQTLNVVINQSPAACLIIHAAISLFFVFTCKNIPALQAASVLATFLTYFICACSSFFLLKKNILITIPILAIIAILWILKISTIQIVYAGISIEFLAFIFIGFILFLSKNRIKNIKTIN